MNSVHYLSDIAVRLDLYLSFFVSVILLCFDFTHFPPFVSLIGMGVDYPLASIEHVRHEDILIKY